MLLTYPDKILVINLCQGIRGKYEISWDKQILATGYNVYVSRIPYGPATLIASNIQETYYIYEDFEVIDGTECYFKVSSLMDKNGTLKESELSRYQSAPNVTEYMTTSEGTWTDSNNTRWDPHTNTIPTGESSYIGTNYLPLNVLRRYQFNKILRDELWLLQDRGEPVYFIKKKRVDYETNTEDDNRRVGRKDIVQYYPPIMICASIASPGQTHIATYRGTALERNTHSWTIYTPVLHDGDIIITKDNKRWEIQDVVYQRSWRGSVTWQQFNIVSLPVTDPVYTHPELAKVDGSKLYQKNHFWKQ